MITPICSLLNLKLLTLLPNAIFFVITDFVVSLAVCVADMVL